MIKWCVRCEYCAEPDRIQHSCIKYIFFFLRPFPSHALNNNVTMLMVLQNGWFGPIQRSGRPNRAAPIADRQTKSVHIIDVSQETINR